MPRGSSLRSLSVATNGHNRLPTGPPSPTYSATTNASVLDLGQAGPQRVITRADLRNSAAVCNELLSSSAALRTALTNLSKASAGFATAVDKCSRLKGTGHDAATDLQACGGLFFMIGNHYDILSASILEQCEKPLRAHFDGYRRAVEERSNAYERMLREKSKAMRQTELENVQAGRKRQRDLQSFRAALAKLQAQVDDLDRMKLQHYQGIYEHEEEVWDFVSTKVTTVARASLDICDRLATKASDPSLETVLHGPDPFEAYATKSEDQIFSVLPPLGIIPSSSTTSLPLAADVLPQSPKAAEEPAEADGGLAAPEMDGDESLRTIGRSEGSKLRQSLSVIKEAPPADTSDGTSSPHSTIHVEAASMWGSSRPSSVSTDHQLSVDHKPLPASPAISSTLEMNQARHVSAPQKAQ